MRENRISGSVLLEPGVGVEPTSAIHSMDAYYGLLRDVSAARRLSRSAFGGRANPGLVAPGDLDRVCWSRISLLKIEGAYRVYASISFHTSFAACLAASSVCTLPINSLPVLKTDTL